MKIDIESEFILIKLKLYCQQWGIGIKYIILYLQQENSLTKREWKTFVTMKDILLIDSGIFNNFWAKAIIKANYF